MTFLPVVERELRVAARKRGTYWSRLIAAVAGWGVAAWSLSTSHAGTGTGAVAFQTLAFIVFLYTAVGGLLFTSDCISEEKRDGTLGLLFLTDLKGYDVVFGKLASTSLKSIFWVLAVMPALAVSVVVGAVTQEEVVRVMLTALNLFFFFLSVSLFASSICRQDNRSLGFSAVVASALIIVAPALARARLFHLSRPDLAYIFSPVFGAFASFEEWHKLFPSDWFWSNFVITQIYTWTLLALACRIVPRSWQDTGNRRKRSSLVKIKKVAGTSERKEVLAVNAFLWRATQQKGGHIVWMMLSLVALAWLACGGFLPGSMFDPVKDIAALLLAGAVLKIWLALEASATLSSDRRNAALELLLTTPLPEKEIIKGQRMALWRQFAEPAVAVFLASTIFLIMEVIAVPATAAGAEQHSLLVGMHIIIGFSMLVDLGLVSWVAMWQGLVQRKPNFAAVIAVIQILVVPYLLFFGFYALASGGPVNVFAVIIFTNILSLVSGLVFAQHANSRLLTWFRRTVADGVPPSLRKAAEEEEKREQALEAAL